MRISNPFRTFLIKTLAPEIPRCVYCDKELPRPGVCSRCGAAEEYTKVYEAVLLNGVPCHSVFHYDELQSRLIHRLKYGRETWLAKHMGERIFWMLEGPTFDAVTFVPMHKRRRLKRGFNQSELIARAVGELLGVPVMKTLQKVKNTPPQSTLSKQEREENLKGSFELLCFDGANKRLLLVDDVKTVGATLTECAELLKRGGARVTCATYCVTTK